MKIPFTKMHGLGNDFVVINNLARTVHLTSEQIRTMANRHTGIGFDQLLLIEPAATKQVDFHYRIFNADGGEVSQCGNGARCFARYVYERGLTTKREIKVSTQSGEMILYLTDNHHVRVDMGVPEFEIKTNLIVDHQEFSVGLVDIGNPHAVLKVENSDTAAVATLGNAFNHHSLFPTQVNVGFMQVNDQHHIKLRVYERGVGETLACGSGACAAVVVGIQWKYLKTPVEVQLLGGILVIDWEGEGQPVRLTGPAAFVFDGIYSV